MKILSFKSYERNTLKGFLEVETKEGYIIKNLTWHQKTDGEKTSEWLGLPAKEYQKEDGSKGWANQLDFVTRNLYWDFTTAVLEALKIHLDDKKLEAAWDSDGAAVTADVPKKQGTEQDLPF